MVSRRSFLLGAGATLVAGSALADACTETPAEQGNVSSYDDLIPVARAIFALKDEHTNDAGVLDQVSFAAAIPELTHIPTEDGGVALQGYNDWNASGLQHAVEVVAGERMQQAWNVDFESIIIKDLPADSETSREALSASAAFIRTRPVGENSYPSVAYRDAVASAVQTGTLTQFQTNLRAERDREIRQIGSALRPTLECIRDRNAALTR